MAAERDLPTNLLCQRDGCACHAALQAGIDLLQVDRQTFRDDVSSRATDRTLIREVCRCRNDAAPVMPDASVCSLLLGSGLSVQLQKQSPAHGLVIASLTDGDTGDDLVALGMHLQNRQRPRRNPVGAVMSEGRKTLHQVREPEPAPDPEGRVYSYPMPDHGRKSFGMSGLTCFEGTHGFIAGVGTMQHQIVESFAVAHPQVANSLLQLHIVFTFSLGNLQLLRGDENIEKGAMPFRSWITGRRVDFHERHMIPQHLELCDVLSLPEFVREREKLIRKRLLALVSEVAA